MAKCGDTAIDAVRRARNAGLHPRDAWITAADGIFPSAPASRAKVCPREAFIGLCTAGFVVGIAAQPNEAKPRPNRYARTAAELVIDRPELARESKLKLWKRVLSVLQADADKKHNQQMDVVVALFSEGLLKTGLRHLV